MRRARPNGSTRRSPRGSRRSTAGDTGSRAPASRRQIFRLDAAVLYCCILGSGFGVRRSRSGSKFGVRGCGSSFEPRTCRTPNPNNIHVPTVTPRYRPRNRDRFGLNRLRLARLVIPIASWLFARAGLRPRCCCSRRASCCLRRRRRRWRARSWAVRCSAPTTGGISTSVPRRSTRTRRPTSISSADGRRRIRPRHGSVHPDFGPPPYGIPYVVVSGDQPLVAPTWTAYGDESDDGAPGRPPAIRFPTRPRRSRTTSKAACQAADRAAIATC